MVTRLVRRLSVKGYDETNHQQGRAHTLVELLTYHRVCEYYFSQFDSQVIFVAGRLSETVTRL